MLVRGDKIQDKRPRVHDYQRKIYHIWVILKMFSLGVIAETLGVKPIHGSYPISCDRIPVNEKGVPKHLHYWYHGHWGHQ